MFFDVRWKAVPLSNGSWQEAELVVVSLGNRLYVSQCLSFNAETTTTCTSFLYLDVFRDRDSDLLFIGFVEDGEPLNFPPLL